jgi:hypothetical protein
MSLHDFFFGKKEKVQQLPTMNPQQQALLQQLLGGLGGATQAGLGNLQGILSNEPGAFEAFEQPYKTQFEQKTIPGLAERFTGAGAQRSSAFGQQLGAAGANLSENLALLRGQLQQSAMGQLQNLMNTGLGAQSYQNVVRPGTTGFFGSLMPGVGSGLGTALGGIGTNWASNSLFPSQQDLYYKELINRLSKQSATD